MRRTRLGVGRSAPRACAQRQGLWARWTVDVGGVLGVLRSPLPWRRRVVAVVAGRSWPNPTKLAPHSSARHWGCSWPTVVVWCVLGVPDGGRRGGGTASWPLVGRNMAVVGDRHCALVHDARALGPGRQGEWGVVLVVRPTGRRGGGSVASWPLVGRGAHVVGDRRRALVRNARAFGPGGRWYGGAPLVLSDRLRRSGVVWLWPLVGRSPVVPRDQHRALLRNARGSPGRRGSVGGGACPMNVVGGGAPSHCCAGVGP